MLYIKSYSWQKNNWHVLKKNKGLIVALFGWQCNYKLLSWTVNHAAFVSFRQCHQHELQLLKGIFILPSIDTECFFIPSCTKYLQAWLFPTINFTVRHIIWFLLTDRWCHRNCNRLLAGVMKSVSRAGGFKTKKTHCHDSTAEPTAAKYSNC